MPGHDTSSFVSRDRGLAGVIDGRIFAPQSGFGTCRPRCRRNVGATSLWPPRKTTPVRRLRVNRKPLRNSRSLAQPPTSGNGLYFTAGHLVESDRLPHSRVTSRQEPRGSPCLTAGTASSPSRRNGWLHPSPTR